MLYMKAEEFLNQLHHEEIVAAIREAEQRTSGEIRVFISRKDVRDPVTEAQAHFTHLGMNKTRDRNGVLIFVAPRARVFAVIGDTGVHSRCGEAFWNEVASELSSDFRRSEFTQGIIKAVKRAGALLGEHFPRKQDDKNELSDEIARD